MKRLLAVLLFVTLTSICWGQSVKDQLAVLKVEAAPLLAKREANRAAQKVLQQRSDDITKSVAKYKEDLAAYDAQNNDNAAKLTAIGMSWATLMNYCVKNLPANATDEMIHDACGERWDGN